MTPQQDLERRLGRLATRRFFAAAVAIQTLILCAAIVFTPQLRTARDQVIHAMVARGR